MQKGIATRRTTRSCYERFTGTGRSMRQQNYRGRPDEALRVQPVGAALRTSASYCGE